VGLVGCWLVWVSVCVFLGWGGVFDCTGSNVSTVLLAMANPKAVKVTPLDRWIIHAEKTKPADVTTAVPASAAAATAAAAADDSSSDDDDDEKKVEVKKEEGKKDEEKKDEVKKDDEKKDEDKKEDEKKDEVKKDDEKKEDEVKKDDENKEGEKKEGEKKKKHKKKKKSKKHEHKKKDSTNKTEEESKKDEEKKEESKKDEEKKEESKKDEEKKDEEKKEESKEDEEKKKKSELDDDDDWVKIEKKDDDEEDENVKGEAGPTDRTMDNYWSIGLDASVALDFHHARESNPAAFNSRVVNKVKYFGIGANQLLNAHNHLSTNVELTIDGKRVDIPSDIQCLIVLNLPSCYGGKNLWGELAKRHIDRGLKPISINDGLLEVVGVRNMMHIANINTGVSMPKKLGQGSVIQMRILTPDEQRANKIDGATIFPWFPCQFDGEPYEQRAGQTITISFLEQSTMISKI